MSTFYVTFESSWSVINYEVDTDIDLIKEYTNDNMTIEELAVICDHILEEDDIVKTISNIK